MSVKQYETYLAETFIEWVSGIIQPVSVTSSNLLILTMLYNSGRLLLTGR